MKDMEVKVIDKKLCYDFILNKHYAHRKPSISYSYGLYQDKSLVGILTIGKPASNALCVSVCGEEYKQYVYELNRLYTIDGLPQNTLSYFVGKVMKMLKEEKIILVSYADSAMNHHGYIYQATNWLFTGATKQRFDSYAGKGKHSRHAQVNDENKHLRTVRSSKYRYIFIPNKRFRKEALKILKFPILPYPKGDNSSYQVGEGLKTKVYNKNTQEYYYE